ncbi:MAG: PEGA domain-containing protein [Alphaproteobacteria bacterium]|nr:PEGA domain-containing protein [Alphaproteobacteria bacterium]
MRTILALAAVAVLASGCATVTRGTNTAFTVETTPGGAAVQTSNGFSCTSTPCTFKMPRKSTFAVTVTKPGYKSVTSNVVTKVAGAGGAGMAGNVILGGVIGAGVDAASGAMLDLVPNPMRITLEPETPAPAPAAVVQAAPAPAPVATPAASPPAATAATTAPKN